MGEKFVAKFAISAAEIEMPDLQDVPREHASKHLRLLVRAHGNAVRIDNFVVFIIDSGREFRDGPLIHFRSKAKSTLITKGVLDRNAGFR